MRTAPDLLAAGIPFSSVLTARPGDPAHKDLARVWHSLYLFWHLEMRRSGVSSLSGAALKAHIERPDGLLSSQADWHRRKAHVKEKLQARLTLVRNILLGASVLVTAAAAANVLFPDKENESLASLLDLAANSASLLLASVAAFSQVKEHGKVAARYRLAAGELDSVLAHVRFSADSDGQRLSREIQARVTEGAEILMQTTYTWMVTMQEKERDVG
jgi:hypothetical protein